MNRQEYSMQDLPLSSVITASICPLKLYYGYFPDERVLWRHAVCKQISSYLGNDPDEKVVWAEIQTIHPEIEPEFREYMAHCIAACNARTGWRPCTSSDVRVRSERLKVFGTIDKVYPSAPYFAVTRSSHAPRAGIYATDRLRIAGYALCMEEIHGEQVISGEVEYIPDGIVRTCELQPIDRRRFLAALKSARRVVAGEIPSRSADAPCDRCDHRDRCIPRGKKLSDLLG
jgi:CRISPR-associated exonuclease Cas4